MDGRAEPLGPVRRWHLGTPVGDAPDQGEATVAFTAAELSAAPGPAVPLHTAMSAELPRAESVGVRLPEYRGKSLVPLLSWLIVHRLAAPGAEVAWNLHKQQGPASCAALLTELGWQGVRHKREGRLVRITGTPPATAELPAAKAFTATIGARELGFLADYGVFSPGCVDSGTELLAEIALKQTPVEALADIGVGYGALAVGLVTNGIAGRAVATDVDCLALWLAERNAAANGVDLKVSCTPDPLKVETTRLTVCNVPTHIDAAQSAELMQALAQRALSGGTLLAVVHASLESRYVAHLERAALAVRRHPGPTHVVLEAQR